MANETNIVGVIEVYDRSYYEKLGIAIKNPSFDNTLNIEVHESYLNNRGSILIPFAKCLRSEANDEAFIDDRINSIISQLAFIPSFSIEVFIDSFYISKRRNLYIVQDGNLSVEKFSVQLLQIE